MKTFLEISISATPSQQELLLPTMIEVGCEGFQQTDTALISYLDKTHWTEEQLSTFQSDIKQLVQFISVNAAITIREIEDRNWNEEWEKTIQPIEVGNRIVIRPSWHQYENRDNRIVIVIDPKMSFGTGYHETTRLTLRLLEKYIKKYSVMLDVGTGTGILAIAAVKLGASRAYGTDIDEWSIENAMENLKLNDVGNVEISMKEVDIFPKNSFDILTANLTLNTNIELLESFHDVLKESGIVLLSGLLQTDRNEMINQLTDHHFTVTEELTENEWIAIAAKK